jgi:hypothetical protein
MTGPGCQGSLRACALIGKNMNTSVELVTEPNPETVRLFEQRIPITIKTMIRTYAEESRRERIARFAARRVCSIWQINQLENPNRTRIARFFRQIRSNARRLSVNINPYALGRI